MNSGTEKLTYLVTNYNNEKYIDDCLQSIVNQKNSSWYCLVADDASKDHSVERIKHYTGEKVRLIQNETNIGQINSLNKLIDLATTDIICIVDSDDAIDPDTTDYVIDAFSTSSKTGFVYTNCIEYDEKLKKPVAIGLTSKIPFGPTSSIVNGHVAALQCFRKSAYKLTEGYDLSLLYAEDLDLGYKLEEVSVPYFIDKYLYKYRRVKDSRGRKLENKLLGYKNRKRAKLYALKRRNVRGVLLYLCKLYVNLEYKKCIYSKKGKKVRKYLYTKAMKGLKTIINNMAFRSVAR